MKERLEAIVYGRVQMVMYRDFVQRKASALSLVGYVENLSDGTVRVVAEGSKDTLEALVNLLKEGSLLSSVEGVESTFAEATGTFTSFSIKYT